MTEITHTDLLDAVHAALNTAVAEDGYALTTHELAAALRIPRTKVWEMLAQLVRADMVECVHVRRVNITGASQRVPGYRVKDDTRS